MPSIPVTFAPSASTSAIVPAAGAPQSFPMPPVDAGNLDTQIAVTGGGTAYVAFAPGAQVGPNVPGCLVVNGAPALLLNNPATFSAVASSGKLLARCVGGPTDPYGTGMAAAQGAAATAATQFNAVTNPAGGTVVITRGTATTASVF